MTGTDSYKIDAICKGLYKKGYVDVIDGLRPDSTFSFNPSLDEFIDLYLEDPTQFLALLRTSIYSILAEKRGNVDLIKSVFSDLRIKLTCDDLTPMHEITSKHENATVTFDCQIIATDAPKTFTKSATFICPSCSRDYDVKCNLDRKISVPYCINTACKHPKTEVDPRSVVTDDVQTLLLQQFMEDAEKSSPVLLTGKLTGKNVRTSFVGQRKRITGLFRSTIDLKNNENDIFIDILSVDDLEDQKPTMPTDEEIVEYKEKIKNGDFTKTLIKSFAPKIYGYDDIKLAIMLELAGGVRTNKRGDINTLLVGDPSMAKSELLKFAKTITTKSIYPSGKGTSSAGLTIGMVKMSDGRMIAQAGVLPICDNGFAFIDEFDKMSTDDRSSMHEAMEQQTVSIAKAGIVMSLPTRTSILAAANPKYGAYDIEITLRDNINIPAPLLSRFDMIWLIRDKVQQTEDMAKATHILNSFTDDSTDMHYNESQLKAFFNYIRELQPLLAEEAKSKLLHIYEGMRTASAKSQMPVGTRQLEALVRLSMAHAKLHLKDCIDVEDVEAVEDLIKKMYQGFGLSLDTNIQQQIYFDDKNTKQHDAITIWDACKNDEGYVKLKHFAEELQKAGMEEEETKRLIDRWEKNNVIKLNKDGSYERI